MIQKRHGKNTHASPSTDADAPPSDETTAVPVPYRRPWAELLKRIHDHAVLVCPRCDGPMVPIQTIKDPDVFKKVLSHLGLPTTLPNTAAARAPPQHAFDFDSAPDDDVFEVPF